jgi:hypothetical protein
VCPIFSTLCWLDINLNLNLNLNLIIYFNCACTKKTLTHKGRNRLGATIPSSFKRGVIHTSYSTPARPCKYHYMVASMDSMRCSASTKYSLANSAQHWTKNLYFERSRIAIL